MKIKKAFASLKYEERSGTVTVLKKYWNCGKIVEVQWPDGHIQEYYLSSFKTFKYEKMKTLEVIKTKWFDLMKRIELRIFKSDLKWLKCYIERSKVTYEELQFISREFEYLDLNGMKDQSQIDQLKSEFRHKFKVYFHLT